MGSVEKFGRGPFDVAIIEGFSQRLSAEEVSARSPISGTLSPEECLSRLDKIIKSWDILDAYTLAKLNMQDAYFIRNKLHAQLQKAEFITKDDATTYLKALDAIQSRIEKSTQGFEDQMIRMQEIHARVMMQAIEVSYQTVALRLASEYNIPIEVSYELLKEALPLASKSLEQEVSG